MTEEKSIYEKWLRKREMTKILGCVHTALFALEYSSISISALYYFKETLHAEHPKLFYSLSMAAMYLSASLSGTLLGRLMDKTRDLRSIMLTTIGLSIIGNILYTLPFSPWLPVVGRFLCGFSDALQPVVTGEMSRCLPPKELESFLVTYLLGYILFFSIGPGTPALFGGIDFHIGVWRINQYNAAAFLLAIILFIFLVIVYFGVANLTKEPGYQLYLKDQKEQQVENGKHEDKVNKTEDKNLVSLSDILLNSNIATILFTNAFLNILSSLVELIIYMEAIEIFHWSITRSSVVTVVAAVIQLLHGKLLFPKYFKGKTNVYFVYVLCTVLAWFDLILLMVPTFSLVSSAAVQLILVAVEMELYVYFACNGQCGASMIIFDLIPKHSASFAQGVRFTLAKFSLSVGFFSAAFVFPHIPIVFPALCGFCFVSVLLLLYKKSSVVTKCFDEL